MNRLKELRKQKGLTQQGLADEISVSKITVLRWENEERQIKPEKAQQLADFFGVSVGYLLGFSNDVEKHPFEWDEISEISKPYLVKELEKRRQERREELRVLRDFAKNNDLTENINNVTQKLGDIVIPYLDLNAQLKAKQKFSDSEKKALGYLENQVLNLNSAFSQTLLTIFKGMQSIDEYKNMENVLNFLKESESK
ncbi:MULTISPECIES: helix-turn-helix transcriptional regulator [Streptococcus]|uniref:XRE family transcriptional regulator n=1 Tax=Streptococcus pseudopneumoniae TaxID=257758 RepID=A0A2N9ZYV1_9STRE|nr:MULTISPECIES: helix-turn-helix transcriptional regulator [Streptococcus]MDG8892598.1 helix-turn-helix transcriptional regulator [Streptococcus pneumoniae]QBX10417.1 DNA-binding protein [Streptococcus satellite phage Javan435]MDS9311617.1 helix-turn-helix transcriptional regulator [Streptococcus pseudopneumoniae]CEY56634.1 XRE family transcriptional regulator [Streptococcus pseudopneumoniae]CIO73625.1 XRE family transcriptional regulator [Streptococcus pseudopneumoniae]